MTPAFNEYYGELTLWPGVACPANPTTRLLGAEIEVGNETMRAAPRQELDRRERKADIGRAISELGG